ncbi:MAG: carboxylesterase/lipase family protein [Erysipelotrichaceae bacterium]|nr:carboxylesterase/lipase family protein [Erysipelotrichaceae bacterium]
MDEKKHIAIETEMGRIRGNLTEGCREFLGIPYAKAERFRYAVPIDRFEEELDASSFGNACPQYRQYYPHLDNPERLFYFREFREGLDFHYDEDCLNLNIFAPENAEHCPVMVFIHGGGFNSGANAEEPFRGYELARRGIITVFINYRVGIFGYLTHEEIQKEYGRDGNFGLDDQLAALKWVRNHIADFGGDPENITLAGQSAGAISIQYLCLNHDNEGLFQRVLMMSGAGLFPKFALPKKAEETRSYWLDLMEYAGCRNLEELRNLDLHVLLASAEHMKAEHKDTLYNTMPVVDGYLLKAPVDQIIHQPLDVGYMIGYTNNDMYAPLMAHIGNQFGKDNHAYIYYFDIDAPGDNNGAFHSCDLRYLFGRLRQSWRPYADRDYEVSSQMADYLAAYAENGNPNGSGRPLWQPCENGKAKVLCFRKEGTGMGRPSYLKTGVNMLTKGNPKA